MPERGTYALLIAVEASIRLQIGGLGLHSLLPGYHVYVGSALGGLPNRLKHHLGPKKRFHWHIDYLLAETGVTQIWYALGTNRVECMWNAMLGDLPGSRLSVPGFGASDCRCRSHLTFFPTMPRLDLLACRLREMGLPQIHIIDRPTSEHVAVSISQDQGRDVALPTHSRSHSRSGLPRP
jgi:Uri superfamily endonuclease